MKRIWENAVGKSLREVLEGTYEKPAEEIYVDNEELGWYQGNLDEEIIEVLRSPEDSSEALITENLAWVDCPTQIHVYNSQTWIAEEGVGCSVKAHRQVSPPKCGRKPVEDC